MDKLEPIRRVFRDRGMFAQAANDSLCADLLEAGAAPDLLAVTRGFSTKLTTYVSVYPGDKELRRLLHDCDAAIARATGESHD